MNLLEEWKKAIVGKSDLDKSKFATLIPHNATAEWLWDAFGQLPHADSMIDRLQRLLSENYTASAYVIPKRENYLDEPALKELARAYGKEVSGYISEIGFTDVAADLNYDRFEVLYDNNDFMELLRNSERDLNEAQEIIGDNFRQRIAAASPWGYPLKEAVLHLTKYPPIMHYILEDVVGFGLSSESYYKLWRGGGDVCFMDNRTILLCEAGPS
jgi:hypothetical protein